MIEGNPCSPGQRLPLLWKQCRPADIFAAVEIAAGRKLPADFAATVANTILRRFRAEP